MGPYYRREAPRNPRAGEIVMPEFMPRCVLDAAYTRYHQSTTAAILILSRCSPYGARGRPSSFNGSLTVPYTSRFPEHTPATLTSSNAPCERNGREEQGYGQCTLCGVKLRKLSAMPCMTYRVPVVRALCYCTRDWLRTVGLQLLCQDLRHR